MKRISIGTLALAIGLYATPALHAQAQPTEGIRFGFGVGPTLPIGTYGDFDKMGYNVTGILQMPISQSPVHIRVDVQYSQTSHDGAPGSTTLFGATVDALYHLGARSASARPYILGGLGLYNVDAGGGSQSKIAYGFGGGFLFGLSGLNAFVEARYMSVQTSGSSLSFVPITVGLMFK
jgi:hypothetical protein